MAAIVYNPRESWTVRTGLDVTGSELNDTIVNGAYPEDSLVGAYGSDQYEGHNIRIWGNEGKDVILNHGYNVTVLGGDDNDSIRNFGSNVRISGNEGSDKFIISGASENNTITDFTDGEDELWFEQGAVKAEIDTYYAKNSIVIKSAETSNTLVRLEGVTSGSSNKIVWYKDDGGTMTTNIDWLLANTNIDSPNSDDTLPSVENVIYGTNGDDFIENNYDTSTKHSRDNVRIEALNGDDTIQNGGRELVDGIMWQGIITGGRNVIINGGVGNDSVYNYDTEDVTINGGEGNDTINNYSSMLVLINGDSGDDSIQSIYGGYKVTINGGDGADTISIGYAGECLVEGGNGNDYIDNNLGTDNMTLDGGAGDDTIRNLEDLATIDGGAGNDYIGNIFGNTVSINGGSGNDTIYNVNATSNMTVNGGKGNDCISLSSDGKNNLFQYKSDDGKDTITGFNSTSTLSISGGSYSSVTNGNDVIIKVGDGSITLKDAKDTSLNIIGAYTPDITPPDNPPDNDGDTNTKKTPHAVLKSLVQAMDYSQKSSAEAVLNEAIIRSSNGQFKNIDELVKQFMSDYRMAVKTDIIGTTIESRIDTFLKDYCGINLNNDDVGAATGSDMGYSSTPKTAESIVPEEGTFYNLDTYRKSDGTFNIDALNSLPDMKANKTFSGNVDLMFTKKGVTIEVTSFNLLSERGKQIISALYSWWTESALNLIQESYGLTFTEKTTTKDKGSVVNRIQFNITHHIGSLFGGIMKTDSYIIANNLKSSFLTITLVKDKLENDSIFELNEINPSGSTSETRGFWDRLFTHEMVHATMMANINHYDELPSFVTEGLAEIIIGLDDEFSKHIEQLRNFMKDDTKLKNVFYGFSLARSNDYIGGYMLFRYLAKQVSDNSEFPDGVYYYDGRKNALRIESQFKGTIDLSNYPSTVKHIYAVKNPNKLTLIGNSADNKIWASKGGSEMVGERGNDTLLGDAGNDTLNGGKDDDTLTGGNGSDTFIYVSGDGNDIFTDISSNDKIKLTSGTIDSWSINGTDVIFKVGSGSITAKNARGRNITIIDSNGVETTKKYDNATKDDIHNQPLEINPLISSTISRISARSAEKVVTNIDSLDNLLTDNGTSILTFTENSGRGIQNVNLSSSEYPKIISLEGGNQNVQFNDTNGNVAIVGESASGSKNIIFGNGDDLGIFFSPNADINATLGSGKDSILVDNDAHVKVDMTDGGAAKIIPYSGSVTLDNYNPSTGAAVQTHQVDDLTNAIENGDIELAGNQIKLKSSTVTVNDSLDGSTLVNLTPSKGAAKKVWFTGINGGSLNAKDRNGSFLLVGNYSANPSAEQNRLGSSITAGEGKNTIFAGSRDFVDGSDGYNQIYLTHSDLRQSQAGAIVTIGGNGRNTIHGFNEGFGYEADAVKLDNLDKINFNFDTDGLKLYSDNARLVFNDNDSDESKLIQLTDESSTIHATFVQAEHSFISQNEDYTPDVFFGTHSALNFYGYNEDVNIDLSKEIGKLGDEDVELYGIDKLQGGDRSSTLIGNDGNNTLVAGKGQTSIQSGAGHDKLFGNTDADKNVATFYYMPGDGRDSIENFDFMTNAQDVTADKVQLDDNSAVTDVFLRGDDVMLKVNDANGFLMLEDAQGKSFRLNDDLIAKVDTNVEFDSFSNCFVAIGTRATLTVSKGLGNVEVWLSDNSLEYHGTMYDGNFKVLDASQSDGSNILAGNELNNSILGGAGNDSLWGGYTSSDDTLVGGSGHNTFFYLQGNGRDVIQNAHDGDNIILDDITLDQIAEANITTNGVVLNFTDSGSLTVTGTADVIYQLADGSKYSANHSTLEWQDR